MEFLEGKRNVHKVGGISKRKRNAHNFGGISERKRNANNVGGLSGLLPRQHFLFFFPLLLRDLMHPQLHHLSFVFRIIQKTRLRDVTEPTTPETKHKGEVITLTGCGPATAPSRMQGFNLHAHQPEEGVSACTAE